MVKSFRTYLLERGPRGERVFGMASSKEYLNYVLEQLSCLDEITHRAMMGEYILVLKGEYPGRHL